MVAVISTLSWRPMSGRPMHHARIQIKMFATLFAFAVSEHCVLETADFMTLVE
jgi:hypothetical protein